MDRSRRRADRPETRRTAGLLRHLGSLPPLREVSRLVRQHRGGLHRPDRRPAGTHLPRHSGRRPPPVVLPARYDLRPVVLPADRPAQSRAGGQHLRLPRQRNPHVVQPRPDGEPTARRLHGRLRSARRETRVVRLQGVIRPGRRDPDRAFRPAFFHRLMDNAQNSSTLPRKPVGGICRVRLASARAFSPQSRFAEYELIDDRSAYVETLTADEGLLRVRHTLTLVFDKHQADAWFDRRSRRRDRNGRRRTAANRPLRPFRMRAGVAARTFHLRVGRCARRPPDGDARTCERGYRPGTNRYRRL